MRMLVGVVLLAGCGVDGNGSAVSTATIAETFVCKATSDMDPAEETLLYGSTAHIDVLSGGDYLFSCSDRLVEINSTGTDGDASSGFSSYRATSVGVMSGTIPCIAYFAHADFNIPSHSAKWTSNGDEAITETVACDKL